MKRRQVLTGLGAAGVAAALSIPDRAIADARDTFPTTIQLPDGWLPEGIAIGVAPFAYFGSRADGDIYRANLVTGAGEVISQGPGPGFPSVGLKIDQAGRLFVAGGNAGQARVVSAGSGHILATYQLTTAPSFINDVVLAPEGAYFTNSREAALYLVPFVEYGMLPAPDAVERIPLGGQWQQVDGVNNANGIARTPDGTALLVVNSATALLYRVDPETGIAREVDLGGYPLTNGDGLLVEGQTLYVVQNRLNRVAVLALNLGGTAGTLVTVLSDPRFDVPTTVAAFGDRLYLPNARFTTPPTPTTPYTAVAVPKP
ncbi:MAG TPA: superoxide dismutase [Micromonosporaceae bacterium]|nr:superoxide dismutase [Micromonosporaceae bacterium]